MPGQEGVETTLTRRCGDNPVKLIAISCLEAETLHTARPIGADEILEKPFRTDELVSRVRALAPMPSASH
jgi:DNA-binding response OmpR family regulator